MQIRRRDYCGEEIVISTDSALDSPNHPPCHRVTDEVQIKSNTRYPHVIHIVLLGRTGNNLFQYALGRILARQHGVPLVLDASWYNAEGWAEVSHFLKLPIQAKVVRRCSLGARALRKLTGKHYWQFLESPFIKESTDNQSFDNRYLDSPANCTLFGYFQTPLYFQSIATELRDELNKLILNGASITFGTNAEITNRLPLPGDNTPIQNLLEKLGSPSSVAIHIRRGDYLHHACFHVCDATYYQRSIKAMRAQLPAARFFVFSDDPEWCKTEFRDDDIEVVDSGTAGKNPLHDLHLMSLASHHIIANSTYSWWAAWLGDKPDQRVIMPNRWYAHGIHAPIEEKAWKSSCQIDR